MAYHTALLTHKILVTGEPKYHHEKMCSSHHDHNTRTLVKFSDTFPGKTALTMSSFCYRGSKLHNRLPAELTHITNISLFKKKLKEWICRNIEIA